MKRADLCSNTKPALDHQPSTERMTIMTSHGSATLREEKPHVTQPATSRIKRTHGGTNRTNTAADTAADASARALRRHAQAIVNDNTIDPQTRGIICYALEINDPWLAELVHRVDAGEAVFDADGNIAEAIAFSQKPKPNLKGLT